MTHPDAEPDTFGDYLGRVIADRRGFTAAAPAALAPIAAACDRVLARVDGPVLRISCIVDRDARPGACFAMPPADVLALGLAWVEAEKRGGRKKPIVVIAVAVCKHKDNTLRRLDLAEAEPFWFAVRRGLPCLSRGQTAAIAVARSLARPDGPSPRAPLRSEPPLPASSDPSRSVRHRLSDARASSTHPVHLSSPFGTGPSITAANPSWRRLSAAFPSRSRTVSQDVHVQERSLSVSSVFTAPQAAQRLVDEKNLGAGSTRPPSFSVLQRIMPSSRASAASDRLRAR